MDKNKRERNVNFTQEETDLLVSILKEKNHIIENKKSDAATWQEKENAWKEIETTFNASSKLVYRDHRQLKLKYEAMKRDIRRKRALQADPKKTDGKRVELTPIEQRVSELFPLFNEEKKTSDEDMQSTSSSPATLAPAEEKNVQQKADEQMLKNDSINIDRQDSEPPSKKGSGVSQGGEFGKCDTDSETETGSFSYEQWKKQKLMIERSKKCVVWLKAREEKPIDKLAKEKIKIARLKTQILMREMEQKLLQNKLLKMDLEHKEVMHKLEKQHIRLKIDVLKSVKLGVPDRSDRDRVRVREDERDR